MAVFALMFWRCWIFQCGVNVYHIDTNENDILIECAGTCTKSNAANCGNYIIPDSNSIIVKIRNQGKNKIGIYCDQNLCRISPETINYYLKDSTHLQLQFLEIKEPGFRNVYYLTPDSTRCFCMYFAGFGNCNYYEANIPVKIYNNGSSCDTKAMLSFSKDCMQ